MGTWLDTIPTLSLPFSTTRSDTFTGASNGSILNVLTPPCRDFSIICNQTGSITSWTIVLEGGLDGTNFSTILTHTGIIGTGVNVFSGTSRSPCFYFRSRCVAIVLGAGTSVTTTILGMS